MATFTLTLEEALELSGGTFEVVDGQTVLQGGDIGLNHYPIFDEEYRPVLNGKIFDYYRLQEIGTETLSAFQLSMRRHMAVMMPVFNKMYEYDQLTIDPLNTVDLSTISSGSLDSQSRTDAASQRSGEGQTTSQTASASKSINSEFPQNELQSNGAYASSGAEAGSDTNVTASSGEQSEGTESSDNTSTSETLNESTTKGYQGHAPELIARARAALVNTDLLVIESCKELFMQVWGNEQPYTF